MSKQTFDFSEALRRMKEGKKVKRIGGLVFKIENNMFYYKYLGVYYDLPVLRVDEILATDWEEVEG